MPVPTPIAFPAADDKDIKRYLAETVNNPIYWPQAVTPDEASQMGLQLRAAQAWADVYDNTGDLSSKLNGRAWVYENAAKQPSSVVATPPKRSWGQRIGVIVICMVGYFVVTQMAILTGGMGYGMARLGALIVFGGIALVAILKKPSSS